MTADEEQGLRRSLTLAADVPPPPDLPQRVLANPRVRRRAALTESPARRWTVIAVAAAAVAGVVIGVTMIGAAARPDRPATVAAPVPTPPTTPTPTSAPSLATVAAVAPLLPRGSYQPWSDQTVPCDGAAAVPSAEQQLLNPEADVTGAVVCDTGTRYVPGDGIWTVAGAHADPDSGRRTDESSCHHERTDRPGRDVHGECGADPRLHAHSRRRRPGPTRRARGRLPPGRGGRGRSGRHPGNPGRPGPAGVVAGDGRLGLRAGRSLL